MKHIGLLFFTVLTGTLTAWAEPVAPDAMALCAKQALEKPGFFVNEFAGEISRKMAKAATHYPFLTETQVFVRQDDQGVFHFEVIGSGQFETGVSWLLETESISWKIQTRAARLSFETLYCDYTLQIVNSPLLARFSVINALTKNAVTQIEVRDTPIFTTTVTDKRYENFPIFRLKRAPLDAPPTLKKKK